MTIPPAVRGWFASQYPTVSFDETWLESCVDFLQDKYPGQTTQQLLKRVETQLLLSDLGSSTTGSPLAGVLKQAATATRARDFRGAQTVFAGKKASALLQIELLQEIGQSAHTQLDVLRERRAFDEQCKRDPAMAAAAAATQAQSSKGKAKAVKDENAAEGGRAPFVRREFPRGMLKLRLSDGRATVDAYERTRITALELGETRAGAKVVLHDAKLVDGALWLDEKSTTVKGHEVEEMEARTACEFENSLLKRLNKPLLPLPPDLAGSTTTSAGTSTAAATTSGGGSNASASSAPASRSTATSRTSATAAPSSKGPAASAGASSAPKASSKDKSKASSLSTGKATKLFRSDDGDDDEFADAFDDELELDNINEDELEILRAVEAQEQALLGSASASAGKTIAGRNAAGGAAGGGDSSSRSTTMDLDIDDGANVQDAKMDDDDDEVVIAPAPASAQSRRAAGAIKAPTSSSNARAGSVSQRQSTSTSKIRQPTSQQQQPSSSRARAAPLVIDDSDDDDDVVIVS